MERDIEKGSVEPWNQNGTSEPAAGETCGDVKSDGKKKGSPQSGHSVETRKNVEAAVEMRHDNLSIKLNQDERWGRSPSVTNAEPTPSDAAKPPQQLTLPSDFFDQNLSELKQQSAL